MCGWGSIESMKGLQSVVLTVNYISYVQVNVIV